MSHYIDVQTVQGTIVKVKAHIIYGLNVLCNESDFLVSINTNKNLQGIFDFYKYNKNDECYYFHGSIHLIDNASNDQLMIMNKHIKKIKINGDTPEIVNVFNSIHGMEIVFD